MIQKDKVQILEGVLQAAKEVLAMHSKFSDSATRALARAEVYLEHATNPKDILDMYRRIHDMQMQSLATLGSTMEKFPLEHTIQELQLIELFRNLNERQKQQVLATLETTLIQKGK